MSCEIISSLTTLIRRSDSFNEDTYRKRCQLIADLRSSVSSQISPVGVITAQIEMLNVGSSEEQKLRDSVNRKILENLAYPHMTDRYEDILEAHSKTFDWIFADAEKSGLRWSDFGKWLRDDGGIYWINGKAGSGKSSLFSLFLSRQRREKGKNPPHQLKKKKNKKIVEAKPRHFLYTLSPLINP
jgi:hypothetical protein